MLMAENAALPSGPWEGFQRVWYWGSVSATLTVTTQPVTVGLLRTSGGPSVSPNASAYPGPHIRSPAFPVLSDS